MSQQPTLPGLAAPPTTIEVGGITFRRDDNGQHLYYDTRAGGYYWYVFRPHLTELTRQRGVGTYWAAHVERGAAVRTLNFALIDGGGVETRDPLYGHTDPPDVDPPLRLLTALAALIASGQDPFALGRTRVECPCTESP